MRKLVEHATYYSEHMHGLKLCGTKPTLIFNFLEQYHKYDCYINRIYKEVYLVYDKILQGGAKSHIEATDTPDRSAFEIWGWPTAIKLILRTSATDPDIASAVSELFTAR